MTLSRTPFLLLAGVGLLAAWLGRADAAAASAPGNSTAAVLNDPALGLDATLARETVRQLAGAGYSVRYVDLGMLTNHSGLTPTNVDLLVLPHARELPVETAPVIHGFLKAGGDLLALGLPAWDSPRFLANGRWITREEFERTLAAQRPQQSLFDLTPATLARWSRSSQDMISPARYESVPSDGGRALHVTVGNLAGWDTFASPVLAAPFPAGHSLTCFRAKGGPRTKALMLEWIERDGSRWIATLELTPEWKWYALPPSAFDAWTPPAGRGGAGDSLKVEQAVRFTVGVAFSHGAGPGAQEYWIADLGTAPHPFGTAVPPATLNLPRLESLSPNYQCFPVSTPATVRSSHEQMSLEDGEKTAPSDSLAFSPEYPLLALHPRPRGVGYNQDRPWRWEPLLGAYDKTNQDYRGAVAALVVNVKKPYRGSVWACFTPGKAEFYRQPAASNCLARVLKRMRLGIFLTEAGAERFTEWPESAGSAPLKVGARIANFGRASADLHLGIQFGTRGKPGSREVLQKDFTLPPGELVSFEGEGRINGDDERHVSAYLSLSNKLVDGLDHDLAVWRSQDQPSFIQIRDGGFWLDGRPWKAHGVNYMPSSGIGIASDYFEHWLGRGAYDPSLIQRDLERVKAMGLNAVSVFIYHRSLEAGHLLDFLCRCQILGLRVNLSLRPGTPLDFRWKEMREIIEHFRLAQNSTVYTYDLDWEPSHYNQGHQEKVYTAAWNQWVLQRYGTLANAATAWGISLDQNSSPLAIPRMSQLVQDGPWRKQAADYRQFLDEFLRPKYTEARRLVNSIDPRHPVSFRMQFAGDPTFADPGLLPYDFYGLAGAVDIWEPEAYGRIGDWERVKAGRFTADYARLCDPALPVMWAEMGYTVWDMNTMAPQADKLEFAARYYRDFYRMLVESGADGVFFWWYPGGFRLNEKSDYGIINPDGTDRELTRVIRTEGARFLQAAKPSPPNYWIQIDRDRDARGLPGVYETVKEEYWKAIAAGQNPGLKWLRQPGAKAPPSDR